MGELLSNNLFTAIVGGTLATLFAGLVTYVLKHPPSFLKSNRLKLYRQVVDQLDNAADLSVSEEERRVIQRASGDPAFLKVIKTDTSDPREEAQQLRKMIMYYAASSTRLADPEFATSIAERLLRAEFMLEDTEKYRHLHQSRRPYFDIPASPADVSVALVGEHILLTWSPVHHPGILHYRIGRAVSPNGPFNEIGNVPVDIHNPLSFMDEQNLTDGARYYYSVTAESSVFRRGYASLPASIEYIAPDSQKSTQPSHILDLSGTFFTPQEEWKELADKCVDREQDIKALLSNVENPGRRLLLIEGFGGLGKTTLASRLANIISQRYTVLWVKCQSIPVAAERFLREMAKIAANQYQYPLLSVMLENPQWSQEEKNNGLLDFLASIGKSNGSTSAKPIAFFFDDYNLVADEALKRLVIQIAESHIDVKVVLILRALPAELQYEADATNALQLQGLDVEGCRKFIEAYVSNYPALKNIDDQRLQRIWKLTGQGVPEALRILISLTRRLGLDDILDELPTLTTATRDKWFDKLFHELSPEEQQVATEVSIFRHRTSLRALVAVSRCAQARDVLVALVDRFVLTFDARRQQYFMHALWSEYTSQRLSPSDAKELHARAAAFYQEFVPKDRYAEVMNRLESCFHFIQAENIEQAEQELISIASTLRSWGFFQEFSDILVEIEKHMLTQDKPLNPALSLEKGAMLYAQGSVDEAIVLLNELAKTGTGDIQIRALQELGWIYIETGNRREAERLLKLSRQFAHQSNLPRLEAEALANLQHVAYHECDYDRTLAYNEERLRILQLMGDDPDVKEAIAWTHHEIGNVYRERGFYTRALELYQLDQAVWEKLGNPPRRVGWILYDIGQIYREQGKLPEAKAKFEEALQVFVRMQQLFGIAHVKIELGRVGARLGSAESALKEVNEAIDLLRQVRATAGEAYAQGALGQIYLGLSQPDSALPYFQQSLAMETDLHSLKGQAWSLHQIGLAYEQQGKRSLLSGNYQEACSLFQEAMTFITQSQELFARIGAAPNIYGIQDNLARIQQTYTECVSSI